MVLGTGLTFDGVGRRYAAVGREIDDGIGAFGNEGSIVQPY